MPTRNKKYKYAVEKEMEWIDEDVRIINEILDSKTPEDTSHSIIELRLRRIWAENERARLYMFMEEFKRKCEKAKKKLINWPPLEEVENLRWTNNHTEYRSITYGFCKAQDCCEVCDSRMRILCKAKRWIDKVRLIIIKRHYGIKKGW